MLKLLPFFFMLASSVQAAVPDSNKIIQSYTENRREVAEAEERKRKILGSLYGINQRMKKISVEKNTLTDELFQAQGNVKNIAKVIANLEAQIATQRLRIRSRLRTLYKLSGEGYLAIVFSRQDPQDLDRTMRFLKVVTDNDYLLIRAYQENIAARLQQKKKMRGQVERLLTIEKNIKSKETMLVAEHKAKSKIVSGLDREKITRLNQMKTLRDRGEAMNLGDLLRPSIFEKKGQLASPLGVDARLVQDFGLVPDDKYKLSLSHKGWLLQSSVDTPVASIYEGRIIFAEPLKGYGPVVIVDHGDHYYSVYGHLARVGVKVGEEIKQGQVLAESGSIGGGRSGLYFEIRHFSEPENPASWIRPFNEKENGKKETNAIASAADIGDN